MCSLAPDAMWIAAPDAPPSPGLVPPCGHRLYHVPRDMISVSYFVRVLDYRKRLAWDLASKFQTVSQKMRDGLDHLLIEFGSDPSQPISKLLPLKWRPMNAESYVVTCMASGKGVFDNCV